MAHAITISYFDEDHLNVYTDDKKVTFNEPETNVTVLAKNTFNIGFDGSAVEDGSVLVTVYDPISDTFYSDYLGNPEIPNVRLYMSNNSECVFDFENSVFYIDENSHPIILTNGNTVEGKNISGIYINM